MTGFNILFGDVPLSAGMSSSAAICSGTAYALNTLFDLGYAKLELGKLAVAPNRTTCRCVAASWTPYVNLLGFRSAVYQNCAF